MPQLTFTPWKEYSQLVAVRDQFYPPPGYQGPDMRPKASSIVWVWKVRGNLPHAVEATALLTDAILHDDPGKNSIFSIRATYSSAFCRFITGLVDSKLHGRRQTMYQKAMTLGVPASFVELRHEATHRELPSLVVLRNAAQRSLEWLWEFYWEKIGANIPAELGPLDNSHSSEQALSDAIWGILQPLTENRAGRSDGSRKLNLASSIRELVAICESENGGNRLLVRALLRPGVLVPETRSLGDRMDHILSTWDDFLKEICRHYTPFLTKFADEMADLLSLSMSLDAAKDPYREGVYGWFEHVLKSSSWALLRKQYLILSYAQAVCRNGGGYWRDRLHNLIESCRDWSELSARSARISQEATRHESETGLHMTSLRDHGWTLERKRIFWPIGVV
ncbi:rRNA-processing protein las1 [Coccidioides posadasii str. Silveira]|uniref:Uncharacterized protein n=1 Tax=Coccidioides posadasii (strain RMSCC 757 / Silveira) TaxID=443226 RepID=E9D2N1_COCPS|nr:conserved hypothetical protein [Coccidioides posadasii str. Silveira]QVM13062.1 rRNA-processing protein las1 [Coccidioides posadasii str. Silveira]